MIPYIRPATEEEIKPIQEGADLTGSTAVWAWPNDKDVCDLAVLRQCMEVDPMHFLGSSGTQRRVMFIWAVCNMLKASGTKEIYFNVDVEGSEEWVKFLEKLGASRLNAKPQFRFKLAL